MNQYINRLTKLLVALCLLNYSCQSVIKQLYEDSTARFNSYYIANEDIKKTEKIIYDSYSWNYDEIIPIISPLDTNNISQYSELTTNAIEKASLLIQRHPGSSLVFDSYILIGLGRLYNYEFKNAITTFKYVNTKSKENKTKNLALIFLMRSYFENNDISNAIEVYKYLNEIFLNKKNKILFHLNAAYIFQKSNNYDETLKNLNKIEDLITDKNQQNKIFFLIGQVYQKLDFKNEAYEYYKKCLKNNPSFELSFYTKINLAKVTELTNSNDIKKIYKYFNRLLKDKKNTDYLDKIFFEIGQFEYSQKKLDLAINNFNKSLKANQNNQNQKFLSYKKLAEIYYNDFSNYELSKLYYDSTLNNISREDKEYKNLFEIRSILNELVDNLNIIKNNDSLIHLASLTEKEINEIVDKYINKLEKESKKEKIEKKLSFNFNDNNKEIISENSKKGNWYFYNDIVVSIGREEFKRIWGNRKLTDNWRISRKIKLVSSQNIIEENENSVVNNPKILKKNKIDRKKIMSSIPKGTNEKFKLLAEIESAYYKLGNIYIQKLHEIDLGKNYFNRLLERFKKSKYVPEVLYQLYLLTKESNQKEAEKYKNELLEKYPNNIVSKLIINPNYEQDQFAENNLLIELYNNLYKKYENKEFEVVISKSDSIVKKFAKNSFSEQFLLLNALAKGKAHGNFIFQLNLKKIIKKVEDKKIIQFANELLESSEEVHKNYFFSGKPKFFNDKNEREFFTTFIIQNNELIIKKMIGILEKIVKEKNQKNYFISEYKFSNEESLIVISELSQKENHNLLIEFEKRYKEKISILSKFVITDNNLKVLFETKNYAEYLNFINNEETKN